MCIRDRKTGECKNTEGLAAMIRKAAADSGLSVYRIAKDAAVDQSTLNKFLNGQRDNLRLDVADRLFEFLKIRVVLPKTKRRD